VLEVYRFSEIEILAFLLVLARVSAFFVTWPVLSMGNVPPFVKALLALAVTLILFPLVGWRTMDPQFIQDEFIFLVVKEAFVGILMGFVARMFFFAIETGGLMISDALGLSNAQILNPVADARTTVIDQFYMILVTMFYLLINGHHYFVAGLFKSFELVPVNQLTVSLLTLGHSGEIVHAIVLMGLKLAAPIVISLFAMNIALGVVGRAVPQMNVLTTSLSVNIILGLFLMFISLPMAINVLPSFLDEAVERVFTMLKAL
jgi:flagellar biosynthesis protein FliR